MLFPKDRQILRSLAQEVADLSALPIQVELRELWKKHNSLQPTRPMILVFPEGAWDELLPGNDLFWEGENARRYEWTLRSRIYTHKHFRDDTVLEKEWKVYKAIHITGWGIEGKRIPSTEERGSWKVDPVIKQASDLNTITFSDVTFDEIETKLRMEEAQGLFGDILDVRLRGVEHISYHLMNQYTSWRGLEEVVLDMFFQPQMIHDAMSLLEEGHRRILQQLVDQNLLTLNNDSYIFSWKPQPAHLVGNFDENLIRNYLRNTVDVAHLYNCVLEMILKDTHTCEHHPECFDRWMQIAREV